MSGEYRYPEVEDALFVVERLGLYIRDVGLLESALARPASVVFGVETYPGLFRKAAVLLDGICRSHPLLDGNKRLAWLMASSFCAVHGVLLVPTDDEGDAFVRSVASDHPPVDDVASWLEQHSRPA